MSETCISSSATANPPPYPGAKPAKRKGPLKRFGSRVKAFLCGKGRSSGPEYEKRLTEASIIHWKACLRRNEAETKSYVAQLKESQTKTEVYIAEKKSLQASLEVGEAQGKVTTLASNGHTTASQTVNAKLKHEETRRVWFEARLRALEAEVIALEAAIAYDEIELQGL